MRKRVASIVGAVRREWRLREDYGGGWGAFLSCYSRVLRRLQNVPLPGRGRAAAIRFKSLKAPVYMRLGGTDLLVGRELFVDDEYTALLKANANVKTILDLGANCGYSTRLWQETWPGVHVIAVEPDEGNLSICQKNAYSEPPHRRPTFVQACAAASDRRVYLDCSSSDAYAFKMTHEKVSNHRAVDGLSIPTILSRAGVTSEIDILKCDIEGAEAELFSNCSEWIGRFRNLVIETHHPYTPEKLLSDLANANARFRVAALQEKGSMAIVHLVSGS